jgi:RNA polymerase sigma-70 factor (ECF subfamily)
MRYGEDLTQESVARRLGIPEGTVKVRLHRLRARLRVALED